MMPGERLQLVCFRRPSFWSLDYTEVPQPPIMLLPAAILEVAQQCRCIRPTLLNSIVELSIDAVSMHSTTFPPKVRRSKCQSFGGDRYGNSRGYAGFQAWRLDRTSPKQLKRTQFRGTSRRWCFKTQAVVLGGRRGSTSPWEFCN